MHGTYVRGWKFDWEEAKKATDVGAFRYADPGVCHCPVCGEFHWREYEVYLCSRCGAEVGTEGGTFGPPTKPEAVRPKAQEGQRIRAKIEIKHRGKVRVEKGATAVVHRGEFWWEATFSPTTITLHPDGWIPDEFEVLDQCTGN